MVRVLLGVVQKDRSFKSKNGYVITSGGDGTLMAAGQVVGHVDVCECCKPSIAVKGKNVSKMFRNWLKGSRDLYLITSVNRGKTFSEAQKLGLGTWPLKGCPMDGGGLSVDSENYIRTAWQRDGIVYYAEPGNLEEKIGEGRAVGTSENLIHWQKGSDLFFKRINGDQQKAGEGTVLKVLQLKNKSMLAVWEKGDQIHAREYEIGLLFLFEEAHQLLEKFLPPFHRQVVIQLQSKEFI